MSKHSRSEAKEIVAKLGGRTADTVSKKVDYVVVGAGPGSKLTQANKQGIKVIGEDEFLAMTK
jgi:DNA ligase (NAD+)